MAIGTLSNRALLRAVAALVARNRATTAELLEHLAEVDRRRLYLGLGHGSMFAYCTEALRMSENGAWRRIQAARAVRRHPSLIAAIADGRLHLSAVCVLAPHLTAENVADLILAATHKGKAEIEQMLGVRFGPPIALAAAGVVAPAAAAAPVEVTGTLQLEANPSAPERRDEPSLEKVAAAPAIAPQFILHVTLPPVTQAKLDRALQMMAGCAPAGDLRATVIDRALELLIAREERLRFGAARKPRAPQADRKLRSRTVPAAVKREVIARDGYRCSFHGPDGRRCGARAHLQFDHVIPLALGGLSTADNVRILCREHNQHEARRKLGREFMHKKVEECVAQRRALRVSEVSAIATISGEMLQPAAAAPDLTGGSSGRFGPS